MVFYIDTVDAVTAKPAVPVATGVVGWFVDESVLTGAGTEVPDWWLNMVRDELVNTVEWAGSAPDKTNNSQLLGAIQRAGLNYGSSNAAYISTSAVLGPNNLGALPVDASGGAIGIVLPAANCLAGAGVRLLLSRVDASTNTVTIGTQGTDYFGACNGTPTTTNLLPGETLELFSDSTGRWFALRRGACQIYVFSDPTLNGVSNNFTPRVGCIQHAIGAQGAGGAGGTGPLSDNAGGGGGGCGAYAEAIVALLPQSVYAATVGTGGLPNSSSSGAGGTGGTSAFAALLTASGGLGGVGADAYPSNPGGNGGSTVTAAAGINPLVYPGGPGNDGGYASASASGIGASSRFRGGGRAASNGSSTHGTSGAMGSGGGGMYGVVGQGGTGGPGGNGLIVIREIGV